MRIYLGIDHQCFSEKKREEGRLGGAERFMMFVNDMLVEKGHDVSYQPLIQEYFDLAIYSNINSPIVKSRIDMCRVGSWTTNAPFWPYDGTFFVSNYARSRLALDGPVVPACIGPEVGQYRQDTYQHGLVVCHSNPNRYMPHAVKICEILEKRGVKIQWEAWGGNRLYAENLGDPHVHYKHKYIKKMGVPAREDLLRNLSVGHIWVYPNFSNDSELICVSQLEAAQLGLPVVVPDREPFREVMGSAAFFVRNEIECADTIERLLENRCVLEYSLERFQHDKVMKTLYDYIEEVVEKVREDTYRI